jgi:phospholipid transport system substrate-binding protein
MRFALLAGGLALAASTLVPTVHAVAGEATDALRTFFAEGRRIIMDAIEREDPEAGIAAARQLIHRAFDVRQAASRVLGREWDLRTPAEQDEFVRIFADLMERAYLSHVIARLNSQDAIRVHYLDETVTGDTAVVDTTVESRAGTIPFQYRMARADGRWTVRDVAVDGISIVESYRAQFARVLRRATYAETIAALRERYTPGTIVVADSTAAAPEPPETPRGATATSRDRITVRQPDAPTFVAPLPEPRSPSPVVTASVAVDRAATVERAVAPRALESDRRTAVPPREVTVTATAPSSIRTPVTTAKPPVVTAETAPARKSSSPSYWVQIGAFKDETTVTRVISQLGSAAVTIATATDSLLRLRLGPFPDRTTATTTLRALKHRGFDPFLVETR